MCELVEASLRHVIEPQLEVAGSTQLMRSACFMPLMQLELFQQHADQPLPGDHTLDQPPSRSTLDPGSGVLVDGETVHHLAQNQRYQIWTWGDGLDCRRQMLLPKALRLQLG